MIRMDAIAYATHRLGTNCFFLEPDIWNLLERLKEYLSTQYRVSGSAVVPNLETDEQWRQKAQELRSGFAERLNREKAVLLSE